MRRHAFLGIVVLALSITSAAAQSRSTLTCTFSRGTVTAMNDSSPGPTAVDTGFTLIFTDIDEARATARVSEVGRETDNATLVVSRYGFSFVETTEGGDVTVTSVVLRDNGAMSAAHSRHMNYQDGPVVAQYFGQCQSN